MTTYGDSAVLDQESELGAPDRGEPRYTGPVCCKCSAPDEGYAVCRVCGYYPKLGKYFDIDYEMEGLVAEAEPEPFRLPEWVTRAAIISGLVILESIASAYFLPLDSWERIAWSLLHLVGGGIMVFAFQLRGTIMAVMDDTSVTALDCVVWPPRAWEALAQQLPKTSKLFIQGVVGLVALLMSLVVIRSIPYTSPFAFLDEAPRVQRKSVIAQAMKHVKPKPKQTQASMEEALNAFTEQVGADELAAAAAGAPGDVEPRDPRQPDEAGVVAEEALQGDEKIVHTARCIVVGYYRSPSDPNQLTQIVVATASRFNNSRSKLEILGTINVAGTPAAVDLHNQLRGKETHQPFADSQLSAVWVKPSVRCEVDFNELGANRQPVNLKLKQLY